MEFGNQHFKHSVLRMKVGPCCTRPSIPIQWRDNAAWLLSVFAINMYLDQEKTEMQIFKKASHIFNHNFLRALHKTKLSISRGQMWPEGWNFANLAFLNTQKCWKSGQRFFHTTVVSHHTPLLRNLALGLPYM